ncbi:MAG TPA: DUF4383 domain-containing protein [Acidimicrobiales bacterium]|nr:DUF4383 domain-containing protein [Acidimicrobiales bacterium]
MSQRLTAGEERQPIHAFAATMGLLFLVVGIAGFIPGITSNYGDLAFAGPESAAKLFGVFEVSVLHNLVHLLFGVGLLAAARVAWSRLYLLGGGVLYLGVAAYGMLVDHESDANFLPINDADTVLHVGLALLMIALGVAGVRFSRARAVPRT